MEILGKRINSQPNHTNKPLRYLRGLFFNICSKFAPKVYFLDSPNRYRIQIIFGCKYSRKGWQFCKKINLVNREIVFIPSFSYNTEDVPMAHRVTEGLSGQHVQPQGHLATVRQAILR